MLAELLDQIAKNKQRKEQDKQNERELERKLLSISMSASPQKRGDQDKKKEYREYLLNQIQDNKTHRERRPIEENTSLVMDDNYRNRRVPSSDELKHALESQIEEKRRGKEEEREVTYCSLEQLNKYLSLQREKDRFNKTLQGMSSREEEVEITTSLP